MEQTQQTGMAGPPGAKRSLLAQGISDASKPKQANPEDQALYDEFVLTAAEKVHAPESRDGVIKRMQQGEPINAIGNTLATLMEFARMKLAEEGKQMPDQALFPAGAEILDHLIIVARSAGIVQDIQKKDIEMIAMVATDTYMGNRERDGSLDMKQVGDIAKDMQGRIQPGAQAHNEPDVDEQGGQSDQDGDEPMQQRMRGGMA